MVDTNGWDMTQEKALWLRSLGVDKMQVSLDSFYPEEHDAFRRKVGSHERALKALDYIRNAGMKAQISTVITPGRIYTDEFSRFLALAKQKDAAINAIFAKPAGMWEGRDDLIISRDESRYISNIADEYEMLIHIRPIYGMNLGCLACKKIISINAFGDVMPCIWMYLSLGNIFDTPLRQILEKGMRIFKKYHPVCRTSEDKRFMKLYQKKTQGRELPIPIEEVFDGTDVE
jgi:MoaA/NifB/PqqE/SkfB family radical SAM enzyme